MSFVKLLIFTAYFRIIVGIVATIIVEVAAINKCLVLSLGPQVSRQEDAYYLSLNFFFSPQ